MRDQETTTSPGEQPESSRRSFFRQSAALASLSLLPGSAVKAAGEGFDEKIADAIEKRVLNFEVNSLPHTVSIEPRVTLLDLLREQLDLTGTKKGCDHGQCGACTVHVNGRRVNACLTLALTLEGKKVTTIEGLANGDTLHPMQEAFIEHDGFQCGYCTPGQIMSAVACIREGHAGSPAEIREYMSGNICRCGAYSNIVDAISSVKEGGKTV